MKCGLSDVKLNIHRRDELNSKYCFLNGFWDYGNFKQDMGNDIYE